ncbi:MAG: dapD [Gammaproteobacteria bacterium]|jgi:2,3,4,5-tetrahydropyridine-2-carboxylate N-succinyltransferase|nr:dapD [Gammaproteobacteria bacterium]
MSTLISAINTLFENRATLSADSIKPADKRAIDEVLAGLNEGKLRVAEKQNGAWITHEWIKKAVLLSFRIQDNVLLDGGFSPFFDKVPLKFQGYSAKDLKEAGIRTVPPGNVRYGSYIAPNTVLLPSFINIGAYVDSGCMIDAWATVGSCAQVGKNVHLSGGAGLGGVLEPLQANPTIIEDDCFIGARSEIVEGMIIERGSVIGMGVFLGQSTRIYHRETGQITYGRIPAGSVVVSGSLPAKDNSHSLYCAVIVKQVDEKTRSKTSLNELLRL